MTVKLDVTASSAGSGFGQDFVIGATSATAAPVITAPAAQLVQQGSNTTITGLSIAEPDPLSAGQTLTVTVTDTSGLIYASGSTSGYGTNDIVLNGTTSDINADLAGLQVNESGDRRRHSAYHRQR